MRPKPPDWIIRITDQEAAASCLPHGRANLICPPLEWEARSGMLFGQDIGCSLCYFDPAGDPNRLDARITFLRPWIEVRMWWGVMVGPIYHIPERYTEWHMGDTRITIQDKRKRADLIFMVVPSVDAWARVMRHIATTADEGHTFDSLCAAMRGEPTDA